MYLQMLAKLTKSSEVRGTSDKKLIVDVASTNTAGWWVMYSSGGH
jgi:hypothetical protein